MDFFQKLSEDKNIHLNAQQKEAVMHGTGPALVLAGPGSGKTTVIISRLAYLILEKGVDPSRILSMTFNRAAAREMEERFHQVFGHEVRESVRFSTLHSFCNAVVRDYERRQNRTFTRIEGRGEKDKRSVLRSIYYQVNHTAIQDDELEELMSEISLVKNRMTQNPQEKDFRTKSFARVYDTYEQYKRENLYIDFDDMLTYAYYVLIKCPDILQRYKGRFQYVQLDEAQDLSKIQWEIVKLLVKPDSHLFVVADDDQSIYGFRGAEPSYILDIQRQFPQCELYYLEQNYRSSKNIVTVSSQFIKRNVKRFDKAHRTDHGEKRDPLVVCTRDEHEQLEFLLKAIRKEWAEGARDMAVLYRNNLSSVPVVEALDRHQIPFRLRQNKLYFFEHWVVLDVLAFLHFALDQRDGEALSRIYYKMNRYLSRNMLEHALGQANRFSVIDGILTYPELRSFQINRIAELKKEFSGMARMTAGGALAYIENNFRYLENVKEYCENRGVSFEHVQNLFGILKGIAVHFPTIPGFLQRLRELEELFNEESRTYTGEGITLSTIHSVKGLEYDKVFMIDLVNEDFPGNQCLEKAEQAQDTGLLEEERRLFYVGMTRAREDVCLLSPRSRNNSILSPSVFVDEVTACIRNKALDEVSEGMIVHHKHFGQGAIMSIEEHANSRVTLTIDFEGVVKRIDFGVCMEKGVLSF